MIIQRPDLVYLVERTRAEMVYTRASFRNFIFIQPGPVQGSDLETVTEIQRFVSSCDALVKQADELLAKIRGPEDRAEKPRKTGGA